MRARDARARVARAKRRARRRAHETDPPRFVETREKVATFFEASPFSDVRLISLLIHTFDTRATLLRLATATSYFFYASTAESLSAQHTAALWCPL